MTDGKLIASITIPAGLLAVASLAWILNCESARKESKPQPPVAQVPIRKTSTSPAAIPTTQTSTPAPDALVPTDVFGGFRGIKWGTDLRQVSDMNSSQNQIELIPVRLDDDRIVTIENRNVRAYERRGEKLSFGSVAVSRIRYETFDDKFYCVEIDCESIAELADVFRLQYGAPDTRETESVVHHLWQGRDTEGNGVNISLLHVSGRFGTNSASIVDLTLAGQLDAVRKEQARAKLKALAKEAAKDF